MSSRHVFQTKKYTHNGVTTTTYTCSGADWSQDRIENGRTLISQKLIRERFNAHLPKSDPRRSENREP